MKQDQIRFAPAGAKRATNEYRDMVEGLKTAQLWAMLRDGPLPGRFGGNPHCNEVYWAKAELRKRGYCV